MTFDAKESSRTQGKPVSLYFIRYGDAPENYYAYADYDHDVEMEFDPELGPVVFRAIPIKRSAIVSSGTLDKAGLTLTTPQDTELADLFALYPPSQVVTLLIFDGHVGDSESTLVWSGRVLSRSDDDDEANFPCEPVSTSLKRSGNTRNYQIQCPLTLYSQGWGKCNADEEAATNSTIATGVNGPIVALPSNWADPAKKAAFATGFASWTRTDGRKERRTILRVTNDDQIVLSGAALGLEAGMAISVTLGCPHTSAGCSTLHDNIVNYGGQLFIPTENPFGVKNNFY